MPTKLKNLKIKRVALVDEGANPDAHIRFAKNKEGIPVEGEPNSAQRKLLDIVAKALGIELKKGAFTYAQQEEKLDYERIMSSEVYPSVWAFTDSVQSILCDIDKSAEEKATLIKQSLSEFSAAFESNAESWAKGESAQNNVVKDTEALTKMRDSLTALIEKATDCGMDK